MTEKMEEISPKDEVKMLVSLHATNYYKLFFIRYLINLETLHLVYRDHVIRKIRVAGM